ncbi:acyl carrier protein [Siccirubricoccus phaeus]|uniref:acyl carrier protein n=1 Tax=Siccirubricoccus phaeus TaxID=2595053 RepID=UPI0011F0E336|nr:acyl carrier protein [Siccirubricoccus phaeus]
MSSPDARGTLVRPYIPKRIQAKAKLPPGADPANFDDIASGHADSLGIVKFILDIESEFEMESSDRELNSCAFRAVEGVIALVEGKLG